MSDWLREQLGYGIMVSQKMSLGCNQGSARAIFRDFVTSINQTKNKLKNANLHAVKNKQTVSASN